MKTKKNYTAQSRDGGGVRHVNLIRVTMPSGGFEVQGYSPPRCVLHPVAVLSIFLSSPPHHLLHLLIFFCTPASCILLHSSVVYSMSLSCHIRWCSLCRCPFPVAGVPCPRPSLPWGFLPCYPIIVVGLCCTWPEFLDSSIRWPLRSARGERAISLVVVHFVGHYASIIFPRCCSPSCWLAVRYAGIGLLSLLRVSLGKLLAITVVTTQAVGSVWGSKLLVGVKERE
jgi:hypothetical protein